MTTSKTTPFRFVGSVPTTLADGRPVEPGEYVELTEDEVNDEYNADLIQRTQMIPVEAANVKAAEDSLKQEEKVQDEERQQIEEGKEGGK